uniref:Uncharacterized protein n=1 Tax=Pipistrellus kuhlii TaxID=59472 RepID=A0A7J7WDU2_PIPKU|nr:hypothetical protein mPipKuh1_008023 [Pipistrellus kuhlii]
MYLTKADDWKSISDCRSLNNFCTTFSIFILQLEAQCTKYMICMGGSLGLAGNQGRLGSPTSHLLPSSFPHHVHLPPPIPAAQVEDWEVSWQSPSAIGACGLWEAPVLNIWPLVVSVCHSDWSFQLFWSFCCNSHLGFYIYIDSDCATESLLRK